MSAPRYTAASVHDRLLALARQRGDELEYLLTRYAIERLLYRLAVSPHAGLFVLKGAVLFDVWTAQPYRATRDLDLLGAGDPTLSRMASIFRDVCSQPVEADGLTFDSTSVHVSSVRETQAYLGVQVRLMARLGQARLTLQVDVGFGDAVEPAPAQVVVPTLLDLPAPRLRAYPRETVVAEKFQAMVVLGIANSRLKDFYDVWILAQQFDFDGPSLARSLGATFQRRQTGIPTTLPLALTPAFGDDASKRVQWRAFVRRGRLLDDPSDLPVVIAALADFLMPPVRALSIGEPFHQDWPAGGPWRPRQEEPQFVASDSD